MRLLSAKQTNAVGKEGGHYHKITSTAATQCCCRHCQPQSTLSLISRCHLRSLRRGLSLRRRLRHRDINVDLSSFPAEQTGPKRKKRQHDHNHENHQYGNYAGTAASATVVSHLNAPLREALSSNSISSGFGIEEGDYIVLAYAYEKGQRVSRSKSR